MSKIILGIDPGIADTGYGVIKEEGNKITALTYGSIVTSPKDSTEERLVILNQELEKIIKEFKPDRVAIEELFFNKNVKTALVVGHARGVVLLTVKKMNLPLAHYTPLQVKQAVSTYGKAPKLQVQKMVKLILGLKELPTPDDAADALAVAICGLNNRQF